MDSWIVTLFSVFILLILALTIVLFHASNMRKAVKAEWQNLWLLLYNRHNLLPNFLETFKSFFPDQKVILAEIIELKNKAAYIKNASTEKFRAELELSLKLSDVAQLCNGSKAILVDTNFLGLRQEFKENTLKIEEEMNVYNKKVRSFNAFLEKFYLKPLVLIFRLKREQIFEFEAGII